jgi:CelD/BcsL family acetyltransferase involved in cellulose biosynthesis
MRREKNNETDQRKICAGVGLASGDGRPTLATLDRQLRHPTICAVPKARQAIKQIVGSPSKPTSITVATLQAVSDLYALRPRWDELCCRSCAGSAFQTSSWALSWCEAFRPATIHALSAWRKRDLVGLALLRPARGGGLTFIGAPLNDENAFLLDGGEDAEAIVAAMLEHLVAEGCFGRIAAAPSESLASLLRGPYVRLPDGWQVTEREPEPAARVALPMSWEQYLDAIPGSHRRRLRYILARAEREWSPEFTVENAPQASQADVQHLLDLREASMRLRDLWEPCLPAARGRRFSHMIHRLFQSTTEAIRSPVAYLAKIRYNNAPVAAGLYLRFQGSVMKYCHGWSPELRQLSPGTVLDLKMLAWCVQQGIRTFDFGRGDEPYKERLGATPVILPSLLLQHGSARPCRRAELP